MTFSGKNIIILIVFFFTISAVCKPQSNQKTQLNDNISNEEIEKIIEKAYQFLSEDNDVDSALFYSTKALKLAEKIKDYESACISLKAIGECYHYLNLDSSEYKTYIKGLKYAPKLKNTEYLIHFNSMLGNYYLQKEEYQEAIKYFLKCLKLTDNEKEKDNNIITWLYNELGNAYYHLSKYEKALDYYFKSLYIKEELNDVYGTASTLTNIGTVYSESNNYSKALEYFKKSLKIAEKENFKKIQSIVLNNIGNIYSITADYDNAIKYLKNALKLKKELNDQSGIAGIYNNIGTAFEEKGDYKIAEKYYKLALQKHLELNDQEGIATSYRNLGNIKIKFGDIEEAKKLLNTALAIADSNNLTSIRKDIFYSYAILYSNLGNHKKSDKYYNLHVRLRDSLNNAEFRNRIAKLQILFDVEKKDRENRLLKLENEAKQSALKQQRTVILFMGVVVLLLVLVGFSLYKMYQTRKKYSHELEKANQQLVESENNLRRINATKDRFFSIISHDLRNPFASMALVVDNLKYNLEVMDKEKMMDVLLSLEDTVLGTQELLLNLLEWSRSQTGVLEFRPKDIDLCDLINSAIPLLESTAATKNIQIHTTLEKGAIVHVDENMLNTVIRNLVSNAIKFTPRGGSINIFVSKDNGVVETSVVDTGVGMSPETVTKLFKIEEKIKTKGTENEAGTGLGLILCKEFIEKHNGRIEVVSQINRGSKFTFYLPYANHQDEKE